MASSKPKPRLRGGTSWKADPKNRAKAAAAAILAFSVVLMVLGIFLGEAEEVFSKASRICLECVGIG